MLGPERAAAFWHTYHDTYISEQDIHFIKQAGFDKQFGHETHNVSYIRALLPNTPVQQ